MLDDERARRPPPRSSARRWTWSARWRRDGRLPVVLFCAGGIATPADASLVMQLGAEGVFVGSGIFKSEDPRAPRPRDRRGHHALRRIRRAWPPPRRASASRWSASRPRSSRRSSCWRRAAGRPGPRESRRHAPAIGILALQGGFEAHAEILRALGAEPREVRVPADLEGLDALIIPGGESTVMTLGIEREGLAEPLRELDRARDADAGHVRRADHARPRPSRTARRRSPSATRSGARLRSFEADLDVEGVTGGRSTRCSSARRGSPSTARTSRSCADVTAIRSRCSQGNVLAVSFHPELAGETAPARAAARDERDAQPTG